MSEPDDTPTRIPAGELSWQEVADMLWLVNVLQQSGRPGHPEEPPLDRTRAPEPVGEPPSPRQAFEEPEPISDTAGVAPSPDPAVSGPGRAGGDRDFGSQLTNPRAIERALRPLSRRVPSRRDKELDEVRVATTAAETGLWLPVTRPAATRRFDVVVVCDTGRSTALWRATAADFVHLLERQGAFRDVRTVQLDTDQDVPETYRVAGRPDRRPLRELADPTGRRIVLVLTDGVGRAWRPDTVPSWLTALGEDNPLAVVHHLPHRLWRLGNLTTELANLSTGEPGAPNRRLRFDVHAEPWAPRREGLPVPVLEMSGGWLARWAGLLTATGPAEVTLPVTVLGRSADAPDDPPAELSAHERVRAFHLIASPAAFRIAALLSAVPIDLAVMRFVQQEMVPRSALFHLAEVLHGGLLTDGDGEPGEGFDFLPGVRAELLGGLRRTDTVGVIREVATTFGAAKPVLARLLAAVADPFGPSLPSDPADIRVEHAVMRALSGPYLSRARRLTAGADSSSSLEQLELAAPSVTSESTARLSVSPQANARGFVDRAELAAVRSSLTGGGGRPVVVLGEGGSGKTELVREYLARHADDYDSVWWVRAGEAADIVTDYGRIAIDLGLQHPGAAADAVAATVLDALAGARAVRWLLVLDGAPDPADVLPYLPAGPAHVVVTSREQAWRDHGIPVPVGRLSAAQSRELLLRRAPALDDAECESLAELHGGLAATVTYLAHRAPRRRFSAGWFTREVLDEGPFRRALDDVAAGRPLLDVCAVLGPRGVSAHFLDRLSDGEPGPVAGGIRVPDADDARTVLLDGGLLVPDGDLLVVPEPVRAEVLARLGTTALDSARHAVHRVLAQDTSTLAPGEVVSHLKRSGMVDCADPGVRRGVVALTRRLLDLGYLAGAIEVAESALRSWESGSAGTPQLAAELGVACRLRGDRARAVRLHRRYGPAVSLARSLRETGEVEAAFEALGDHAPATDDIAVIAGFTATARLAAALAGRPLTAEIGVLQEEVVARLRRQCGDGHPATLAALGELALTRRLGGEARVALELDRTLVGRATALLGEGHRITLACAINFATDLHETGQPDAAVKLDRRTARIAARAQGERHTATLVARWNLALAEGPEPAEADAGAALSRELGRSHPLARLAAAGSRCWYEPDPGALLADESGSL
ncbi:SAV_2336 N-terminal domain-related protein [Amycolatopsis tolypomycina]|uniref:SAV_2336 N-terminal domain-related protein n=1 Tax=Amycolatopsis tolypomycina TaxID=208445 RepID=UPI0033A0E6C5